MLLNAESSKPTGSRFLVERPHRGRTGSSLGGKAKVDLRLGHRLPPLLGSPHTTLHEGATNKTRFHPGVCQDSHWVSQGEGGRAAKNLSDRRRQGHPVRRLRHVWQAGAPICGMKAVSVSERTRALETAAHNPFKISALIGVTLFSPRINSVNFITPSSFA